MTDVIAGRYELVDPIGAGGSGTVWRAFDRRRDGFCAAKLLRQRDAGELLRFVREQSVRLDHPHIVSPYSWAAEDGTVLIASDLVGGGSLHTLLGDYGPLAEGTVVAVLGQVLAGLSAVHDAELIHRDVKPANVLVRVTRTGPLQVVLTDFGLTISRRDARLTQVGMVIGTPGYLPPEVLLGGVTPDPRHDLYAVGRLALTLLRGDEYAGPDPSTVDSIRDPVLRRAVDALVRMDPVERPSDATAASALLAGAGTDREPHTRDGDPVDVLDQLPPLPAGWGPSEPRAPWPAGRPARATVIDVPPTAPGPVPVAEPAPREPAPTAAASTAAASTATPPAFPPAPTAGPTAAPGLAPDQTAAAAPDQTAARRPAPGPTAAAAQIAAPNPNPTPGSAADPAGPSDLDGSSPRSSPSSSTPSGSGPAGPSARRRSRPLLVMVAVGLILVAGVMLGLRLLGGTGSDDPSDPPTTGPGTGPPTAGGTGAPPTIDMQAGDPCTWQQEGDRRTGAEGILVCTLADGDYRWRVA